MPGGELREVRKKKKKNNRNKKRGTGFEEYFCDPPMTLEEYNEEQNDLYPPHRPFVERIQESIQRFRARRHMNAEQDKFFSRYLILGGVDATQRQFQGTNKMTKSELKELTKGEIRDITANDVIQRGGEGKYDTRFYNPEFPEHWDVDFAGIAAGFISGYAEFAQTDPAAFKTGVEVVSNFLKYVDRHDVCPECTEDIHKALEICDRALKEIPRMFKVGNNFPGDFNSAARTMFCKDRMESFEFDNKVQGEVDETKARRCFGTLAAVMLEEGRGRRLAAIMDGKEAPAIETAEKTYEIATITPPCKEHLQYCHQINKYLARKDQEVRPCGYLTVVPTFIPDGLDHATPEKVAKESTGADTFIMEGDILKSLDVGMKLDMVTCTLVGEGFKFIKYVTQIRPTFYTFLPQELMLHFREPLKTNRPAPNVHDNDVYEDGESPEDVLASIPIGDMSVQDQEPSTQEELGGGEGQGGEHGEDDRKNGSGADTAEPGIGGSHAKKG
ncbi:Argonaute complex, subunit Arb1 [Immersiella caudata]|uniref:Argonaute complex, subunit Arb1 n=1 Tax=Immersiella caudata TaxID=314043 RepID=A0AA39WRZ0_9PEZI|nr:Argonaute complex, subunit Arb1 [Immersiella caudata]